MSAKINFVSLNLYFRRTFIYLCESVGKIKSINVALKNSVQFIKINRLCMLKQ